MTSERFKDFKCLYIIACLIVTIWLSAYSVSRYFKDEDSTVIELKSFQSSQDALYPSFSFCIMNPIIEKMFDLYGNEKVNMTSYIQFLNGEMWDDHFLEVEYDNVTISLSASMVQAEYMTHSDTYYDWTPEYSVSYRSSKRKCFTIDAPKPLKDPLLWTSIKLKNDIYPNEKRTSDHKMKTYLHYPGQRFCSYYTVKDDYHLKQIGNGNYVMQYRVQNIAVITRRDKRYDSCIKDGERFDFQFIRHWLYKVGCYPPHSSVQEGVTLPVCNKSSQMKLFSKHPRTVDIEAFGSPCKVIDRLDFIYSEYDDKDPG